MRTIVASGLCFAIISGGAMSWTRSCWAMARVLPKSTVVVEKSKRSQEDYHQLLVDEAIGFVRVHQAHRQLNPGNESDLFFAALLHGDVELVQNLISKNSGLIDIHFNSVLDSNLSPLMVAALSGSEETANYLLQIKPELLLEKTRNHLNHLHFAARSGSLNLVQFLVNYKIKSWKEWIKCSVRGLLTEVTTHFETPFHFAVRSGSLELIDFLAKLQPCLTTMRAPLQVAIEMGDAKIVKHLLQLDPQAGEAKVQISSGEKLSWITLIHKAINLNQQKILKLLIKNLKRLDESSWGTGSRLYDSITHKGMSPLHSAIHNGNVEIAQVLIEAEPRLINRRWTGRNQVSPFLLAIQTQHFELVKLLLKAQPGLLNEVYGKYRLTALHEAVHANNVEAAGYFAALDPSLLRTMAGKARVTPRGLANKIYQHSTNHQAMKQVLWNAEILVGLNDQNESEFLGSLEMFCDGQLELIRDFLTFSPNQKYLPRYTYEGFLSKIHEKLSSVQNEENSILLASLKQVMKVYREVDRTSSLKQICLRSIQDQIMNPNRMDSHQCDQITQLFQNWAGGYASDLIPSEITEPEYHSFVRMMEDYLKNHK